MSRAPVLAAILSGVDEDHLPVQRAMRVFLADQLASLLASSGQFAQPRKPAPHTTVGQRSTSFRQGMVLAVVIYQGSVLSSNRFPVGLFGPQKVLASIQYRLARELLAGQSERVGSL
jgi:hypothetical protein